MNEIVIKNPLTDWMGDSIIKSKNRLNFAVPFLSSFANKLLSEKTTNDISDKRIVTRFDDSSLASFDLATLKRLLDLGFSIQFDNTIHLKLYITDNDVYITSSNLTNGGFEDNVELTVKTDLSNTQKCIDIFNEIWKKSSGNKITYDLLEENWGKYEILRKRETYAKKRKNTSVKTKTKTIGSLDIQKIIDEIYKQDNIYAKTKDLVLEANKLRGKTKEELHKKFDSLLFYAPELHEHRRDNLFYDFVYGYEYKLAGTGLREQQCKTVFEHPDFEKVVNYLYPEMLGIKPWNLSDRDEFLEFCNGIFEFKIPQYFEAMPIRLASYFYPECFIPIFKLDHLENICKTMGLETDAKTRGDKLFAYNSFLAEKMKSYPCYNYIKADIAYKTFFIVELYNGLLNGETYDNILNKYNAKWKRDMIKSCMDLLTRLGIIQ